MQSEFIMRAARPEEREVLEELQRRASLANPGDREALLANPDAIMLPARQIANGLVCVAEIEGVLTGFAALEPRADGDVELDGLFVEPGCWKRGVGKDLVEHCCVVGRQLGAHALHVVGNPHALGFYRKCGFEPVGHRTTRFGTGVVMRRPL
jgi:N-acetylglutamate synthase-like GNAT family acetyltransferase